MTIVMLDILHKLLDKTGFLSDLQARGKKLAISTGLSCPAMVPLVADALWEDAYLQYNSAYTSSRAVRSLRVLEGIDLTRVTMTQKLVLQDDNVGSVPTVATSSLHRLLEFGVEQGWQGFCTLFWPIGDLDPVSHYLAQAAWRKGFTPEMAYQEHAKKLYGIQAVLPFSQSMRLLEDATLLLDVNHLGLLFQIKDCMSSRIGKDKEGVMTETLWHVLSTYAEVRVILSKTLSGIKSEAGRKHMQYWIGRMEFSENILLGISQIDEGNHALKGIDHDLARVKFDQALASFRQALESLSRNVRDDSDRATLAVYYDILVREAGRKIDTETRR